MVKGGGFHSVGRRKSAIARVNLKTGTGKLSVNGQEAQAYFGRATLNIMIMEPLALTENVGKFDIVANVCGGGKAGQAGALRMAIGRALLKVDGDVRPLIKPAGVLTRDAREVERKKYGRHKARKRPQFSKR